MQIVEAAHFDIIDETNLVAAPLQFAGFADQLAKLSRKRSVRGHAIDHLDASVQFRGAVYTTPAADGSSAYLPAVQQGSYSDAGAWIDSDAPMMDDEPVAYSTAAKAARAANQLAKDDAKVEYRTRLWGWFNDRSILLPSHAGYRAPQPC